MTDPANISALEIGYAEHRAIACLKQLGRMRDLIESHEHASEVNRVIHDFLRAAGYKEVAEALCEAVEQEFSNGNT